MRFSIFTYILQATVLIEASRDYYNGYQQSDCTTPESKAGECVELGKCSELMQLLKKLDERNLNCLKKFHCGFAGRNPKVCCPIRPDSSVTPIPNWDLSSNSNLPQVCGEDLNQKIIGGDKADVFEFPWIALLEYTKSNNEKTVACGGVLINKRYVLTAAHCIKGKHLPSTWKLVSVRFGEYDTRTDGDCVRDSETTTFCIDDPVNVSIEKQIAHEDYQPQFQNQPNDIALLRLSRDVTFTGYMKPICLPSNDHTTHKFFYIAGWGKSGTKSESNIKLKRKLPLANFDSCVNIYQSKSINLSDEQICAGGQRGHNSCRGDSGGPLMGLKMTNEGRILWTVYGIGSFGPSPCHLENWPGVYTNITKYVPWILSKIEA